MNEKINFFESLEDYEYIFPRYEDYHAYLIQVLFFMKYYGHFTLQEIYSLPIFYRNKMLEILIDRLEKENGKENEKYEAADGTDLNAIQKSVIQDPEKIKQMISSMSTANNVVSPNLSNLASKSYSLFNTSK